MTTHSQSQPEAHFTGDGIPDPLLLASLLGGMDAALFAVDRDGRVTHWNQESERLLGWSAAEALGRRGLGGWAVRETDAADVHDRLLAVTGDSRTGGSPRQVQEFPFVTKDGSRLLVRAQTAAVRDADGRVAGAYCAFSDVHAQLDLERRIALSEALLAGSAWAVLLVDADLRTVALNEAATRALAVSPVEMLGEPLAEFLGSGLQELEGALEHTLSGEPPSEPVELWVTLHEDGSLEDEHGEARGGLPGGRRRCWLSGFLPLGSPLATEPSPLGVAWVFRDVTLERRQSREATRRRFRDGQLNRASRAAADCADPMDAAVVHLEFALAGFADHALLDLVPAARPGSRAGGATTTAATAQGPGCPPGRLDAPAPAGGPGAGAATEPGGRPADPDRPRASGPRARTGAAGGATGEQERGRLVRITEAPGPPGPGSAAAGVPVAYRRGHPALEALDRGVPVRATGGGARGGTARVAAGAPWAVAHRWPGEAMHALCVPLRSRGRVLGVVTFLRGSGRSGFDRADAAFAEDVALRVAAAVDLAACG
ncbi:PAS domain-containing protein [Streptomyces bohaiensis]|uniref:PAS domain-containing protein n=2 Tax=Streptomyces bohaiensis TaxID=1431344 RepID=UPI003B98400B